ncbi:MAG TPA: LysM peptidoglycan-binding domain-containing M23 family metallopeptidase [Caulobacteraceae bacterium]|nr:LysM peptidoglycan-binding domain-containing M23 family metallopeptidase [Caulobacteraceae bacterium]
MRAVLARAATAGVMVAGLNACASPSYPATVGEAPTAPARPQYPIALAQSASPVAPPPAAPAAPPAAAPAQALPAPAPAVESSPLPPAATAAPAKTTAAPPAPMATAAPARPPAAKPSAPPAFHYAPYATYAPAPAAPYAPAAPSTYRERVVRYRAATGGPVIRPRGMYRDYVVQRHDHVDAIARDLGTTRQVIVQANRLEPPYRLQPGEHLRIPVEKAYVAQSGDTLADVARRFDVSTADLASLNDLSARARLSSGERIALPSGFRDLGPGREREVVWETRRASPAPQYAYAAPPAAAPRPAYPAPAQPSYPASTYRPYAAPAPSYDAYQRTPAPDYSAYERGAPAYPPAPRQYAYGSYQPTYRTVPAPSAQPYYYHPAPEAVPAPAAPDLQQVAALGRGRFIWPVHGEVISPFGSAGVGRRNDGVDLKSPLGTVVRAAAAGEVVYAGDQVPGFGNLVLVKHADGWVTAYAHMERVTVQMRQSVAQGQEIGEVGETGGVAEPQLHFEIRYAATPTDRARPIDPLLLLPATAG